MAKLTGQTIADSYDQLLIVDGASGITSSLQALESADTGGSVASLQVSTVAAAIDNPTASSATQGGKLTLFSDDGAALGDTHRLGVIEFSAAEDTSSTITIGARIEAIADAAWSASENGADMVFYTTDGNASQTEVLRLTADNLVGIGTDNPSQLLHLKATDNKSIILIEDSETNVAVDDITGGIWFQNDDAYGTNPHIAATIEAVAASEFGDSDLVFGTSFTAYPAKPTERMRILSENGNVGIGTDAPGAELELKDASAGCKLIINAASGEQPTIDLEVGSARKWQIAYDTQNSRLGLYNDVIDEWSMVIMDTGLVGIGDSTPDAHLDVENSAISTTGSYTGVRFDHTKTAGDTDSSDDYYGLHNWMSFNDADADFGVIYGMANYVQIQAASSDESNEMVGIYNRAKMEDGDIGNLYGSYDFVDVDAGVVDVSVYGMKTDVDIDGGTIGDHIWGHFLDINTTVNPTGNVFGIDCLMGGANLDATADYFIRFYDTENSDTTAQITALAGVATFDSGDFSGAPDYAEYFESKDGNAIAVGTTVKLDGDKVVACSEGDTPIGVVRPDGVGTSAYKAGAQNLRWHGKYLYDDYNELQMEDYEIVEWKEEISFDEYIARGKDETGGVLGGHVKDKKVEGSKAIPAKDAVTQQKTVDEEVEEEVTTTEVVLEDGKYVQKTTTETVTKTVKVPQYDEEDLYDEDGEVIGKHQIPIMETVEEAVAAVDAVPDTYSRKHDYHSDRIPEGLTVPDDAETITPGHQRKKLNPDYDYSKHEDYKARPERDEWNLIGLLGQIPITKGQPVADNWTKMKDVSDTVEMWFVK